MTSRDEVGKNGGLQSDYLKGKTLRVYYLLLNTRRSWTARGIQRRLHFSSPSLSLYHLNKLRELSLVKIDDDGMYYASQRVRVGILRYFIDIGNRLVPRFLFYAVFFISLLLTSLLVFGLSMQPTSITLIVVLVIVSIIFISETKWILQHGFQ